jgi:hypothetical protein
MQKRPRNGALGDQYRKSAWDRIGEIRARTSVAAGVFSALYNQELPNPPILGETLAFIGVYFR